jgi:dephospho-CoA kinase
MKSMKVIGITGGIGSGKSLVARILIKRYGACFLDTDRIAKEQMAIGGASYQGVVDYFGRDIVQEDGSIDRRRLSEIVFRDSQKLQKLNALTHPNVREAIREEITQFRDRGLVPYLIIETALMIEAGFDDLCDEVWYVYTPEEIRRSRLKKGRNYSDERIDAVFASQSKAVAFRKKYSKVIENTGDVWSLEQQVEQLLQ